MIIYFAGDGKKQENSRRMRSMDSQNWGVLLSFKSIKTKSHKGNSRFQKLIERIEEK
jgi:hypothetical protein